MHVEGSLRLCIPLVVLVTLLSLEQCSQSERFHLRHIQMVNKHPVIKQN